MLFLYLATHNERPPVHYRPFPDDPELGRLAIYTEPIDHSTERKMLERFDATAGLTRNIELERSAPHDWHLQTIRVVVLTPRISRLLHRVMRSGRLPVRISSTEYLPPECDYEEMQLRISEFLDLARRSHLSFMQEALEEIGDPFGQDPYKAAEMLFSAGLDERYIIDRFAHTP